MARTSPVERRAVPVAIAQYLRARLAGLAGDRAGAVEALERALLFDSESAQLRAALAEELARTNQVDRAESAARRAVSLSKSDAEAADARLVLGKVLAMAGRTEQARRELEAASRIEAARFRASSDEGKGEEPLDPESWRARARMAAEAGDGVSARAVCEELAALDGSEGEAALREVGGRLLESKRQDEAVRALRRAVEIAPFDEEAWKLIARAEEARDRLPEARAAWERVLSLDGEDAEALLDASQLALRQQDVKAARGWLLQLLDIATDELGMRVRVAAVWLDAQQPSEALEVAAGSEDPRLVYLRGAAFEQLRRWEDAAALFARVVPSQGEIYASARVSLAHALWRAGRMSEAVRALRQGLEVAPKEPSMRFALGEAYDRAGQPEEAMREMRAVLEVKSDHAEALNYLGYAYAERGERLDEAQRLVERALAVEPDNGYYLDSLGWVFFKRGELGRAVKALERAAALVGSEATVLEHLGDVYRAVRRSADAAAAYRRALSAFDAASEAGKAAPALGNIGEATPASRAAVERKLRELGRDPVTSSR